MAADSSVNMTTATGDGAGDVKNSLQDYFSRELLRTIEDNLVLSQFASKQALPEKSGGDLTMKFFRYAKGAASNVSSLTEGTTPTANVLQLESVSADLAQYGQVIDITDLLTALELFNNVEQATLRIGRDAALKLDEIIRNEVFSNVGTTAGDVFSGTATDYTFADITAADALDFLDAATGLKINNASQIDGYYVGVIGPQISRDLMNDSQWINAHHYAEPEARLRGEVGRLHGIRFVETSVPHRLVTGSQYTYNAAGTAYGSIVFGDQAYGVPSLSSQSPFAPSVTITSGADKSDPLNQKTRVGFKALYAAKTLQPLHISRVYSKTGYTG